MLDKRWKWELIEFLFVMTAIVAVSSYDLGWRGMVAGFCIGVYAALNYSQGKWQKHEDLDHFIADKMRESWFNGVAAGIMYETIPAERLEDQDRARWESLEELRQLAIKSGKRKA